MSIFNEPLMFTLFVTSKLFLIEVVPVAAPNCKFVAAANAETLVAFKLKRVNDELLVLKVPPSMFTVPSTSKLCFIVVKPELAPKLTTVAAPNA